MLEKSPGQWYGITKPKAEDKQMIITIGREHGSNGHDIARELARQLDYQCLSLIHI